MGFWANRQIEEGGQGYRSPGSRDVCATCIEDPAFGRLFESEASVGQCNYCGRSSRTRPIVIDFDLLLDHIDTSIRFEYRDPIDELPYDDDEGGYYGATLDTEQILLREGCEFADRVYEDVIAAFGDTIWCRRDYFRLREEQALIFGWRDFCERVTYQNRYFFLISSEDEESDQEVPVPSRMLDGIGRAINETGLVRTYPEATKWFRARPHPLGDVPSGASELGPPPRGLARANRMSAAGIAMFYGTADPKTAIKEVMAVPSNARFPLATVGTFVSARASKLIDLTDLPAVPSLFDEDRRHLRAPLRFLEAFIADLSKPISLDGQEHLEYVPTQVVTEWFRRVFRTIDGDRVGGVVYPSARTEGGVCCVLFADEKSCCDFVRQWTDDPLKVLALVGTTTEVVLPGFKRLAHSSELIALRREGLKVFDRDALFAQEEWAHMATRGDPTPDYMTFCEKCRQTGAKYGVSEHVVRRMALQKDYHPELEDFSIEAVTPSVKVVVPSGGDPLFQQWLLYTAWRLGLHVVLKPVRGPEVIAIAIPFPSRPDEPLTDAHRPPLADAFRWRLEMPSGYPPAAAGAVAQEYQEGVRELAIRLGYDLGEVDARDLGALAESQDPDGEGIDAH